MLRKILAVIGGYLLGSICIYLVQMLGHQIYPLPEGMDPYDADAFSKYVETAPFMAIFMVIIAYAIGMIVAGFASTKIAGDNKKMYAIICGIIYLVCTIINLVLIPSPIWFMVAAILVCSFVLIGYRLAVKKS